MIVTLIAGARPNFMKVAPIIRAIEEAQADGHDIHYRLVHTGQHYDKNMSDTFFDELQIPRPDINLGCGGGTPAEQTAAIMVAFERYLKEQPTDLVMVVGDVTSTMACSIVAKKMNTKVAHVEAGIRSWDLTMPEEINRMVTDSLADYLFTTSEVANRNLMRAGAIPASFEEEGPTMYEDRFAAPRVSQRIYHVGNVMIDTLVQNRKRFCQPALWKELRLTNRNYVVMTLHRPANVDEDLHLRLLMEQIIRNVNDLPIIFPIHPRTAKIFKELGIEAKNLKVIDPQGYLEFNYLVERSKAVITDSGGITEETTVMHVPCLTLRDNTERPETCTIGTNMLVGTNPDNIRPALSKLFSGNWQKGEIPQLWDGHAAERIVNILTSL